jgi:hypothetical protein
MTPLSTLCRGDRQSVPHRECSDVGLRPGHQQIPPPRLVLHHPVQELEQSEVGVHRLEVRGISLAQVTVQRAEHRGGRWQDGLVAAQQPRQVDAGEHPGGGGLRVSLDARQLAGEQRHRIVAQRQVRRQRRRGVDVRVAMDRAEAEEFSVL